ncbi:hypothetical protein ALC62_02685, partial [Cyphomyrmex costatus]
RIAREKLCGSNSAVTSGQLRRASRGGFVPSKLSWIHDVYRPVFRVQGHRVLRRVACPRTSDDVSAFSGRPHGELLYLAQFLDDSTTSFKAARHIGCEGVREEEDDEEEEEEKHEESETRERERDMVRMRSRPLHSASHMLLFPRGRPTRHFHVQRICARLILFPIRAGKHQLFESQAMFNAIILEIGFGGIVHMKGMTPILPSAYFSSCFCPLMHTSTWCDSPFKRTDRREAKRRIHALRQCRKKEIASFFSNKERKTIFCKKKSICVIGS